MAAAVATHEGRMSDLRTALRERQEELAILGGGGVARGPTGANASGGGGVRQIVKTHNWFASAYLRNPQYIWSGCLHSIVHPYFMLPGRER